MSTNLAKLSDTKFNGCASSSPKNITILQAGIVIAADCTYPIINNNTSKICIIFLEWVLGKKHFNHLPLYLRIRLCGHRCTSFRKQTDYTPIPCHVLHFHFLCAIT